MSEFRAFAEITPSDLQLVGGKGLSLGLLAAAGLPVPEGFCITTAAFRKANGSVNAALEESLVASYRSLGGGLVAVRSSATAEDGAVTSFAGQQETILGVDGEAALKEAVERCWASLHTERAKAYRQKQGVDDGGLAMAVVVQRLIHAEVAGVLFTHDPHDPTGERMLVEASWGLGEAVVSGRVTPDSFQIDRASGAVRERRLGVKNLRITAAGEEQVATEQQSQFCLDEAQLAKLAELGRKVENYYGEPRDVEWAYADGRFWLLQARPITTVGAAERERVRREEIEKLRKIADPKGTVWSRCNLIEVLPEPTPMTWAVIHALLSGSGGSGLMYRDFGFTPDPALEKLTVYDLIGGRPYCNLSREPRLQSAKPLFGYNFALYKQQPLLALDPKPDTSRMLGSFFGKIVRMPGIVWHLIRTTRRIQKGSRTFAEEFRNSIVPAFLAEVEKAESDDLSRLDPPALRERFEFWVRRTLVEFARHSLKPTLFAQFALQVLEQQLKKPLGQERTCEALTDLSAGAAPDPETDLPRAIREAATGVMSHAEFMRRFGHRGSNEMELAQPRWNEDSAALDRLLDATHPVRETPTAGPTPLEKWERLSAEAKLNSIVAKAMAGHVERLHVHLGLREMAKHHLMRGYAQIRRTLVELDRRFNLNGGIFFLTPEELPALIAGNDFARTIDQRRKYRSTALSLEIPPVLFSDDLETIGRPQPAPSGAAQLHGIALSAGVAEGPALVLTEPSAAPASSDAYILVCPSTDPAWVPLFVGAKGLVMESGGSLSHGAIVAREFGLPAVGGLPGVLRQIKTGQRLRIDGGRGVVTVLE
jgi:pyruvate,water dikinase